MTALEFKGKGSEYFKIWIVNILLMIVTLGLYYPWAKVRTRRYFYGNSTLEGQNFDYHATGKQLFIGYMIALALLIAYVVIQQISPQGAGIVFLIFFLAFPWIIWRSLQFNMRVTSFSNVRFGFDGKLGPAYFNYMLLPFLLILAVYGLPLLIGIGGATVLKDIDDAIRIAIIAFAVIIAIVLAIYMYALMKKRNTRYVINGSRYGQGQFATNVNTGPFAVILLKTIGLFFLVYFGLFILLGLIAMLTGSLDMLKGLTPNLNNLETMQGTYENPIVIVLIAMVYIGFIVLSIGLFAYSYARQRKYIYNETMLDDKIAFKSTLGARKFAWVSITNLLLVIFTLGLATPWTKVRMAKVMLENTYVDTSLGFNGYVTAQQKVQSSLGDQIGDAFDVDVGIGL